MADLIQSMVDLFPPFTAIDPATNVKRSLRSGMFATDSHGRLVISEEGQAGKESSRSSLTEALDEVTTCS